MLTLTRRLFGVGIFAGIAAPAVAAPRPPVALMSGLHVAGDAYYQIAAAAPGLRPGVALTLRREPGNPHDPLAVEILGPGGHKLGYLPRARNEAAARLLDAGLRVTATVTRAGADPSRLRYDLHLA